MNTDTKQAPVKYNAYGCTIATGENWLDGQNYGGTFVATTSNPDLVDTVPPDEWLDRATWIAMALSAHSNLIAQLHRAQVQLDLAARQLSAFGMEKLANDCSDVRDSACAAIESAKV